VSSVQPAARARSRRDWQMLVFRVAVFAASCVPLALLLLDIAANDLGPDPGEAVTRFLGTIALQWLMLTLTMTPLRHFTGWAGWIRVRRMLGLFAFFYASLHLLSFLQFIVGWQDLWSSFTRRPYIIAGMVAFVPMAALAVTSTKGMMKRLGKRWKPLHRAIYPIVGAAWVHFIWQARSDIGEMVFYGALILVLLGLRLWWFVQKRRAVRRA